MIIIICGPFYTSVWNSRAVNESESWWSIVCKHYRSLIDFQDQLALLDWKGLLWKKGGDNKSKQLVSECDGNHKLSSHVE